MTDKKDYETENEGEFLVIEPEIKRILTKDEAADCLNCVGPSFRKTDEKNVLSYCSCSYAYLAMDAIGRNLTDVSVIPSFEHVLFLDLSNNCLTDNSLSALSEMEQLISLIIDNNHLETVAIPTFPQLQILSLKNNRISTFQVSSLPNLEYLELSGNNIQHIQPIFWGPKLLPKLRELGLRANGLKSAAGVNFPTLVSLFLAENDIMELEGLEILTNLKFLHLRSNPLNKLDGFSEENPKLFYLNIRECQIRKVSELRKLSVLPKLERIVIAENPFCKHNYRLELIALLPRLRRIDKSVVSEREKLMGRRLAKKIRESGIEEEDEKVDNEVEFQGEY